MHTPAPVRSRSASAWRVRTSPTWSSTRNPSDPPGNIRRRLARDHAAPEPALALPKAASLGCGRVRPLAWCSRPRHPPMSPGGSLKLCMFTPRDLQLERGWPGILEGETVAQVAAQTLQAFFTGGGTARRHAEYALADVQFRAPVLHPPSVRDFYAFEQHVKTARAARGLEVPPEWYELPVFYFSYPAAIYGPGDEIPYPPDTQELDYELEVAAIIGADERIGGFTVMNDWSARDLQRVEMKVGLGPAKGKDFATSLGPVLVTPDELRDLRLEMIARVNGEERSRGNSGDMYYSWDRIVAQAGRNTRLLPGDVIGS